MTDLAASWEIPNPYALVCADFDRDVDSFRTALAFLSDLAGGVDESEALTTNGGTPAQLTGWKRSEKFRRVYQKCQRAGEAEREALSRAESDPAATEGAEPTVPPSQRFVPLESLPARRGVFGGTPSAESWGGV